MSTSSREQAWLQLGRAVRNRRTELGLTQLQAARKARLSVNGWGRIEAGHRVRYATLEAAEEALRWRTGTANGILHGDLDPDAERKDEGGSETHYRDASSELIGKYFGADQEPVRSYPLNSSVRDVMVALPLPSEVARYLTQDDVTRIARMMTDTGLAVAQSLADARRVAREITKDDDLTSTSR